LAAGLPAAGLLAVGLSAAGLSAAGLSVAGLSAAGLLAAREGAEKEAPGMNGLQKKAAKRKLGHLWAVAPGKGSGGTRAMVAQGVEKRVAETAVFRPRERGRCDSDGKPSEGRRIAEANGRGWVAVKGLRLRIRLRIIVSAA
jgi:hypothetical protein